MFSLGCPNNNFQKYFELKIYFQFWFLGHPVTIEIFWVRQRLGFFYRNNFYLHNLTIKFIFGSKRNVFSWKRSIRVVRKSDFFYFLNNFSHRRATEKIKILLKRVFKELQDSTGLTTFKSLTKSQFCPKELMFLQLFRFFGTP